MMVKALLISLGVIMLAAVFIWNHKRSELEQQRIQEKATSKG